MRPLRVALLVAFGVGAAGVACDLNPQPLPPESDERAPQAPGFGGGSDNGAEEPAAAPDKVGTDGGALGQEPDGGLDASGAMDGGDAGEGGSDAAADGG